MQMYFITVGLQNSDKKGVVFHHSSLVTPLLSIHFLKKNNNYISSEKKKKMLQLKSLKSKVTKYEHPKKVPLFLLHHRTKRRDGIKRYNITKVNASEDASPSGFSMFQ